MIQRLLAKLGYSIVRTELQAARLPLLYSHAEIEELDRDLDKLETAGKDLNGWDSRETVRKYLTNDRINFYHELIAICISYSLDFSHSRILDSGTCTGYLLRVLGKKFPNCSLSGCDYQDMFVNLSSALVPSARIFKGNVFKLDSAVRYDVIFCTEVLEHIRDTETPIPIILKLLDDGGSLVLTVPNGRCDNCEAEGLLEDGMSYVGHVNFWSPESWRFYIARISGPFRAITGMLQGGLKLFAIIKK
jgi:2-polyprenyl-3-methyl-5-hydroxy-6-metoxy-1,4-benzoquinol methylase